MENQTQTNITLSEPLQRAFRQVNTKIEAKKKLLQQRLQLIEGNQPESNLTYNQTYY